MYMDETIIAGLLVIAGSIAVGGYVLYYAWHDLKHHPNKKQAKH